MLNDEPLYSERPSERSGSHGDEVDLFTETELTQALEFIMGVHEARAAAIELCTSRDPQDDGPPYLLSPDLLDLLSLVSSSCAERVRAILKLSDNDARERREEVRRRLADR